MKQAGAWYVNQDGRTFLATYNYHNDIFMKLPDEIKPSETFAHFTYGVGKKGGVVEIFEIGNASRIETFCSLNKIFLHKGNEVEISFKKEKKRVSVPLKGIKEIIGKNAIGGMKVSQFDETNSLFEIFLADVKDYSQGKASVYEPSQIETVNRIRALTEVKFVQPPYGRYLHGGKQEFVSVCKGEANIEFAMGCPAGLRKGENPAFDGTFAYDYFSSPWGECPQCYAGFRHKNLLKSLIEIDADKLLDELKGNCMLKTGSTELLGRPVKTLRIAKWNESYTPFTWNSLLTTLELCTITKTKAIIPSKFLPYDPTISELAKKTSSAIFYSTSRFRNLEVGAREFGSTIEWELEQGEKYAGDGVNTNIWHMALLHEAPHEEDVKIINSALKRNIKVQLLGLRIKSEEVAKNFTGKSKSFLICGNPNQERFFVDSGQDSYYRNGVYQISPLLSKMHEKWYSLVANNNGKIRLCHHDPFTTYCGGCFLGKGSVTKTQQPTFLKKRKVRKQNKK